MVERDERTKRSLTSLGVVPDRGSEGEQALEHASDYATWSSATVAFQVELDLQGRIDQLDELAQRLEEATGAAVAIATVGGSDELDAVPGQEVLELLGAIPLVGQDPLARPKQGRLGLQQIPGHLAFVDLRVGQGEGDRQSCGGADEVESQPPEPARVAGAVAV